MNGTYAIGTAVRVCTLYPPGHLRTPYYIRGKTGFIECVLAEFPNPEAYAYGRRDQPKQRLYRVRFRQSEVWPQYTGPADDTVDVELYHHWLEPVEAALPVGSRLNKGGIS